MKRRLSFIESWRNSAKILNRVSLYSPIPCESVANFPIKKSASASVVNGAEPFQPNWPLARKLFTTSPMPWPYSPPMLIWWRPLVQRTVSLTCHSSRKKLFVSPVLIEIPVSGEVILGLVVVVHFHAQRREAFFRPDLHHRPSAG